MAYTEIVKSFFLLIKLKTTDNTIMVNGTINKGDFHTP